MTLLKSDPLVAWNAAKLNLSNGQVEQALSQFSLATVEHYRALILTLGTAEVIQSMGAVGQLTPIYVGDEDAQYYFTTSVGGQDLVFPVTLVRENGQWRIRRF